MSLPAIVIGHRATPKKRGAVKDKLFPAFFPRRSAAQRSSVEPAMINSTVYLFLTRGAASGGAVPLRMSSENITYMGCAECFLTYSCLALAMRCVFVNFVVLLKAQSHIPSRTSSAQKMKNFGQCVVICWACVRIR